MIDFSGVSAPVNLSTEYILSKLDEVQIFRYYFGHFELGKVYPSKFRTDKKPSTGFFIHPATGALLYNDLRTGEKLNCFTFVKKLYGLSFMQTLHRIASDFGLIKGGTNSARYILNQTVQFDREYKKNTLIQFIPGGWNSARTGYWQQYSLTTSDVKADEVYAVQKLFINKVQLSIEELCFAYIVKEKIKGEIEPRIYVKIYQPYSTKMKWLSNVPLTVPFGLHDLKYGNEQIVIAKAKKDMMILKKLYESVIGSQNESESALTNTLVKHLCFHFPKRTIMWDNDETGVENCKKFNEKGFGYFNIPKELLSEGIKDISDYVKTFGLKALEKLLRQKNLL